MPMISDAASAIKSRFGFHQSSSEPDLIRSSPVALLKSSASKDSLLQMSNGERDDFMESERSSNHSFELQEDPSFWKDHNVQVIIRIRPLSNSEISLQGYNKCIRQDGYQTLTWTGHPESRFTFDLVADENVTQEKLFKVAGLPMVENCMGGYNSCMFAYGQTGSGKTHTMLGDIDGGTRRHSINCGMTPRVFEHLFSRIQKVKEIRHDEKLRFTCKCSFLEIYNEQILDLLDPSSVNLQIREDSKKGVYVENLKELEVSSARDVMQQLIQGASNRKVAATNMNRASSRSHSVFTCIIESKWESQGVTHHRFSRLNLVDLAGSERQKSSGAEGERLKEATNINKSLSTLGLVIMNLVSISNGKSLHVPYRDSKLTFLLQDSLGGNSKTIIIANISPSNCCSLETLSTLKFAQRAKYIKNNAIVNEDASGDVLAMRMQIQQLKKEVSRLRGMVNGGAENQENDNLSICFPGSPGSFKWEGLQGSFSPLISDKKMSQKKEYEAALVAAFRREMDKEATLQALAAENKSAMHLAKQREDEIQGLKMRLRFREAGIKRLEAVASGKISAEAHLLQEKEEHLKEIEVLRNQVDRNQEVTRFAMENLRLKEELRRLKSFHEEGEREQMNEQIMTLQNKLLEALDWKLMHESDTGTLQKGNLNVVNFSKSEDDLLTTNQDPSSPWRSSINEENEFLQLQAIQNLRELETLHRKLNSSLEEKEKLESRIEGLILELEEEKRSNRNVEEQTRQQLQIEAPDHPFDAAFNDQMELKTMVDAIAAASQREAEAHERAITLAKENDELRTKLKFLIEDNNKLIELYEGAVAETKKLTDCQGAKNVNQSNEKTEDQMTDFADFHEDDDMDRTRKIESLENQLQEMHEENDKLMGLYEKAMQERDGFKRMFCSSREDDISEVKEFNCPEKLVEVDGGESFDCTNDLASKSCDTNLLVDPVGFSGLTELDKSGVCTEEAPFINETDQIAHGNAESNNEISNTENMPSKLLGGVSEEIILVKDKLENAQAKLASATEALALFGLLEKTSIEVEMLSKEIEEAEEGILVKQLEIAGLRNCHTDVQKRKSTVAKKLSALKSSISSFSSSISYWEQREDRARARMDSSSASVEQKKEAIGNLRARMEETEIAQQRAQQSEVELRNQLSSLKSKLEDEIQKKESEKVLFTIDNIDITNVPAHRNWQQFGGKATELLKSEEERTKLQNEMKQCRENLGIVLKEIEDLKRKSKKLETEKQALEKEITSDLLSLKELELGFDQVLQEKKIILEMAENGKDEIESMIIEYHQCVFELELKEGEIKIVEEELRMETSSRDELRERMAVAALNMTQLLNDSRFSSLEESNEQQHHSWSLTQKMEEQLQEVRASVLEAKSILGDRRQSISHT